MASPTILLVDDDIVVLSALSKLLGQFGYTVSGASNSVAARGYVANDKMRFDLIVTDVVMPGINGMEFLTAVKKTFPDVPVIVVTGHADEHTTDEALGFGAFAYLVKPLNTRELVDTIERALRSSARTSA